MMHLGEHNMQRPRRVICQTRLSSPPRAPRPWTAGPLFRQEVVLPEQWQHRSLLTPEQRLMLAVLHEAVACFRKCAPLPQKRARRLFAEVNEWIHSGSDDSPFSFENICAVLEIDSAYLRERVARWSHLLGVT